MRPTKGSDPIPGNREKNCEIGPGMGPHHIPITINIKVSHGNNECEVAVPSDSSFGNLKSVAGLKMGLKPETLKLLFMGIEKKDDDNLQTAGVKNSSKVSLIDDMSSEQKIPEEVKETTAISIGAAAVAEVREEVDKLSEKVSALKVVVDSGTKVDVNDILYLTEMLMRQLLKLDGIEAEGEAKVQRKHEVRRVQSLVEMMDILKSKNSSITRDADNTESISTPGTVQPDSGSSNIIPPAPPSAPQPMPTSAPSPAPVPSSSPSPVPPLNPSVVPHSNPSVAPPHSNLYPDPHSNHPSVVPHSNPSVAPPHSNLYPDPHSNHYLDQHSNYYPDTHSYPYSAPHSNLYSEHHCSPYPMAYPSHYANPYPSYYHYAEPQSAPYQVSYSTPPPLPYSAPYPGQYSTPPTTTHNPYTFPAPHSNSPYPPSAPHPPSYPAPHPDPYNVPSSNTKVTQNWEHFD